MSRLYGKVWRGIIENEYGPLEIEQQAGFRAGRCIDHIFTIMQLNETMTARNHEIHLLFVDLTKAYDTVLLGKLWEVLEKSPVNTTAISAGKQMYDCPISEVFPLLSLKYI